jgi:hypothetical protein
MSLATETQALVEAMAAFGPAFQTALAAKAQEAENADNASELQNQTPTQVNTSMNAALVAHEADDGVEHFNAASLAAAGILTQTQVNAAMAGIIPNAALPFSRFGTLSYLPAGVSGSFEGATMNFESRRYPGIVENDGTYVFLRNGTTGTVMGVYYAYVLGAVSATTLPTPIRTNFRYQPAYFPAGTKARYVFKSDGACILGRLQSTAGVLGDYFISITNGTFDATKHVGAIIPAANFPALADASVNVEAIVGGGYVYLIVSPSCQSISTPVEFEIYTIPLSSVQTANGGNVTPTQVKNWVTTGFGGNGYAATGIRVANMYMSTNASDQPMVTYPTTPTSGFALFVDNDGDVNTDSAIDPVSGNLRIRVTGLSWGIAPATGVGTTPAVAFWINVNPATKQGGLEGPATAVGNVTYNSSTGGFTYNGAMFPANAAAYLPGVYQGGELTSTWTSSGFWFGIRDSDPPDYGANVYRAATNALYANRYAALAPSAGVNGNITTGFVPAYGTALGGRMTGTWPLPGGYMMASSYGPKANGTFEWGPVLIQPGASGYTYTSQYNGTLTGFSPSVLRTRVSDMGLSVDTYSSLMSEIAASGTVTTSGGRFMDGYNTTGPLSVTVSNNVLVGSGAINVANSVLLALKSAALTAVGASNVFASNVEVFIPQNTNIPPFGFLVWTDTSKNLWVSLLELSITSGSRTGTINSFGIVTVQGAQQMDTGTVIQPLTDAILWTAGACTIYEGSDAYFIGFMSRIFLVIPGTGASHTVRFAMPKSTNRPNWSTVSTTVTGGNYSTPYFTGYPGIGFGETDQYQTNSDNYTKIILNAKCTTLAQYTAWTTLSSTVLTSQDVAQGWIVYFTDIEPLILNGQFLQLQPTSINLTSIQANPANTTFYVYVTTNAGVAQYVISATPQAETVNNMFIGTIVTGASAISTINMQKVSRIDKYRLSTTSQGSAISVSPGNPGTAGDLAWT